jgi:predicted RNA-binding Zn ribbon-like protein
MSEGTRCAFDLSGGHLGLDFVNTVGGMRGVDPHEHLLGYGDLVAFARQTEAISERLAGRLAAESRRRPEDAARALEAAKIVREALYRVFSDRLEGRAPRRDDLAAVNAALGRALSHRCLAERDGRLVLTSCTEDARDLEAPLWAPLSAAADLLASPEALARLRVCGLYEDEECSWLFLDKTKARTRRWCSMKECGNRAKARRHYQRVKDGGEG